jgi:hypothetical protein
MPKNTPNTINEFDPWLKNIANRKPVPHSAQRVCEYELDVGIDTIYQTVSLNRTETCDELWITHRGRVARTPKSGSIESAAKHLLSVYIRAGAGFQWPTGIAFEGVVDQADIREIVQCIEYELTQNRNTAASTPSPIVDLAHDLNLDPEPTGMSPASWKASCPGRNHHLYINSETNTFGCGYCRCKGGEDALRGFVDKYVRKIVN